VQNTIRLLIVEDDLLIAQDLKEILEEVQYNEVLKARNYNQAVDVLQTQNIDFVLLDINLNDSLSGIDLANYINQHFQIPFIYITSYSDAATISSVKQTKPAGFLLKPYSKALLLAKLEIALFNYSHQHNAADQSIDSEIPLSHDTDMIIKKHLLVKDNYRFIKIPLTDILWFESDKNYVEVKTRERKYTIRCSLKKLATQLPPTDFVKCFKQFIINIKHVESFTANLIVINRQEIPISRSMQEEVLKKLKQ
jgi:DNA-binding LytR/AlgR family response regulator